MGAEEALARYPESPCIGVCRIGAGGYCEGCFRTLGEIARWGEMSTSERLAVFRALEARARPAVS